MTGNVVNNGPQNSVRTSLREQMPVTKKYAYFDHAAVAPIPKSSAVAIQNWADQSLYEGDIHWPEWSMAASRLRSAAAELIHAQPSEMALVPNTTFGINLVAHGFRWSKNPARSESVVVLSNEFASNLLPWLQLEQRGIEVRKVSVPASGVVSLDALRDAIDSTTRLVTVSWVGYFSGYRIDLARVCELVHAAGAQLFVDAIQGLGAFTLNATDIPFDYMAADGHKWMLGPEGAGLLFIRQANLDQIEPMMLGWNSLQASHHFQTDAMKIKQDASRFEGGSLNLAGFLGLGESLQVLLAHGCHRTANPVAECVLENADAIEAGLRSKGATVYRARSQAESNSELSGILTFELPGQDPIAVRKKLLERGIVVSVRHDRIRVATHAYNNQDDIDRLIAAVREIARLKT